MITYKTEEEIRIMREGGKILATIMDELCKTAKEGVTGKQLNDLAEKRTKEKQAKPAFLGFGGFPSSLCVSLNNQIVHGLPTNIKFERGDILKLDYGILYKGFNTDMARTVIIGETSDKIKEMIEVTKKSLNLAIRKMKIGNYLGDVSGVVEDEIVSHGFSVVRQLVGHGVGKSIHEDPKVPNFRQNKRGMKLERGLVLAIEPMVTMGDHRVIVGKDGWTYETIDGSMTAHFENTVAVGEKCGEVLTRK